MDVVHIPLSVARDNVDATRELAEYLVNNDVHGIITLPVMVSPLEKKLRAVEKGNEAMDKLIEICNFGGFGGSEIYPMLEDYLKGIFGTVINMYASTEFIIPSCSDGERGCQSMNLNPSYAIAGIIPIEEIEKECEDYVPKMILLHHAPIGTQGELVLTLPHAIPWINARTDDYITVVSGNNKYNTPAFEYWARGSSILDIGGAKVYPEEFYKSMNPFNQDLGDWIIQSLKGQDVDGIHDVVLVHYEGDVEAKVIYESLVENTSEFGDLITDYPMFRLEIYRLPDNTLNMARSKKAKEVKGPGPYKHKIVKGHEYPDLPHIGKPFVAGLK